jgi:hypothetical protein
MTEIEHVAGSAPNASSTSRAAAHVFRRLEQRRWIEIALQRDFSGRAARFARIAHPIESDRRNRSASCASQGLPLRVKRMRGTPFTSLKICRQ